MITDKVNLDKFRTRVNEQLEVLKKEFGVEIKIGVFTYGDSDFTGRMTVKLAGKDGEEADKEMFMKFIAYRPGIDKSWWHKEIKDGRMRLKITGINPRASKNIFVLTDIDTGKKYGGSIAYVNQRSK